MSEFFTASVLVATFAAGVRLATPFLLAAWATASLATAAPAVLTVLALAIIARRSADAPQALTLPFSRSG